jgi:hypothetical protein
MPRVPGSCKFCHKLRPCLPVGQLEAEAGVTDGELGVPVAGGGGGGEPAVAGAEPNNARTCK